MEKARGRLRHVRMRETNASEPLLKHRNRIRWHQNQGLSDALGSAWRQPTYWPCGVRCAVAGAKDTRAATINLDSVRSELMAKSGRAMIEPLIAGEPNPAKLAALADRR